MAQGGQSQSPASAGRTGGIRGGGRGQGTSGQPPAATGNATGTGAQGAPPAINPLTGTPNPTTTGAGEGTVRTGGAPSGS
jgi:hypothetical protein